MSKLTIRYANNSAIKPVLTVDGKEIKGEKHGKNDRFYIRNRFFERKSSGFQRSRSLFADVFSDLAFVFCSERIRNFR